MQQSNFHEFSADIEPGPGPSDMYDLQDAVTYLLAEDQLGVLLDTAYPIIEVQQAIFVDPDDLEIAQFVDEIPE